VKWAALVLGATCLLSSASARAQGVTGEASETAAMPARVVLSPPSCNEALVGETLLRMLRVELAGDGVERVELATPGGEDEVALARVSIEAARCEPGASEFLVTVDDVATRKSVRRAVDLSDVPTANRARALALAVAELVRASWLELTLPDVPSVTAPVPQPVRDAVRLRAAAGATPGARGGRGTARWIPLVGLALEGRTFLSAATNAAGFRAVVGVTPPWGGDTLRVRLRLDGGVAFGNGASLLGDVGVTLATGALAVTFGRGTTVGFECGPRVELGAVYVRGDITPGRDATGITADADAGFIASVGALAALRGRFGSALTASLEAELGWVFGGIDARAVDRVSGSDVRAAGVFGPSVGIRLGFGWEP
jgi:hypothetical protein